MREQRFKKFEVWNKAIDFIEDIYRVTGDFPTTEIYGLSNQLRRAAISIAMNIAEGSNSGSDKEFHRFLNIAARSSHEIICGLEIANRLEYIDRIQANDMCVLCDEICAMISGFKKKLKAVSR